MLKAMSSLFLLTSLFLAALLAVECLGENNRESIDLVERDTKAKAALELYKGVLLSFKTGRTLAALASARLSEKMIKIQQRRNELISFDRNWNEYVDGFGDIRTNFWIGLETLYNLIEGTGGVRLRINMWFSGAAKNITSGETEYFINEYRYVEYSKFSLGSAETDYHLHVSGYHGTIQDALSDLNLVPFSTKDTREVSQSHTNCYTVDLTGGWWYKSTGYCPLSNLNGDFWSILWYEPLFKHINPPAVHANRIEMYIGIE